VKILALVGSYRTTGNTSQLVAMVRGALDQEAARAGVPFEFETLHLGHARIDACRGCRACFDRGEEMCPVKDDLQAVKARMRQADGVLVASPVYVHDVSGITKNWIDRLAHVCHRPEFAGKCAYLLATVGGSPTGHALGSLQIALSTWGFSVVGRTGLRTGALMRGDEARRFEEKTGRVARALFQAVHRRAFVKPSFRSLMTFKIQQKAWQSSPERGTVDHEYWRRQGWLDPGRDFYIAHEAGRLKVALARLAGGLLFPFVT